MFNELLILQVIILFSLFFCFFVTENFFIIINAIMYLTLSSLLLYTMDLDIYVSFLLIIDLGVFFVLIAFLINLSHLFQSEPTLSDDTSLKNLSFVFVLLAFASAGALHTSTNNTALPNLVLTLYNWYSILNFSYFSDLQLLSDLYYSFFPHEFVLMNFYLYLSIVLIYTIVFLIQLLGTPSTALLNYGKPSFLRYQNMQKQINQSATVRVWSKKLLPQLT